MLQRLPIALAQLKVGNTFGKLLNKINHITYFLQRAKQIFKKVFDNTINSKKLSNKMDTIFMNSKHSKASSSHRLLLNLSCKIDFEMSDRYVPIIKINLSLSSVTDNPPKRIYVNKS